MSLLLRDVEVEGRRTDVRVDGELVGAVGPELASRPGEEVVDGRGGALIPGLVDHHLHLHALAAAQLSVRCGPPEVTDAAGLAATLAAATADRHGWVRGVGHADGSMDGAALDRLHAARPVRVQHRSGALWTVNTAAARALGLAESTYPGVERDADGHPTGRLWRADTWLRERLPAGGPPDLTAVGRLLTGYGITAVTDATPDLDAAALASLTSGALPQHVHLLGAPLDAPVAGPRVSTGPFKIVLADSGLPELAELTDRIRAAHAVGRGVAVHCVTRAAFVLLLAAFDDAGVRRGDRIEHAAIVPAELVSEPARRGLAVVTQPGFLGDRGDTYLAEVDPVDLPDLYRCASLVAAGVPLALSSDAPYGPLDPWTVLRAAVERRTRTGTVVGGQERLDPDAALTAMLAAPEDPGGPARRVRPGVVADLVLLQPQEQGNPVRTVLIGGVRRLSV